MRDFLVTTLIDFLLNHQFNLSPKIAIEYSRELFVVDWRWKQSLHQEDAAPKSQFDINSFYVKFNIC